MHFRPVDITITTPKGFLISRLDIQESFYGSKLH